MRIDTMVKETNILARNSLTLLKLEIQQPGLVALLARAAREHRRVEEIYGRLLSRYVLGKSTLTDNLSLGLQKYFERNFFSILFLSIFISLKIPRERRLLYGVILHCVRAIVTCTDNILDNEQKGTVHLAPGNGNNVLDNTMLMLMSYGVMSSAVKAVAGDENTSDGIERALLDGMSSVAAAEGLAGRGSEMLKPDEGIKQVHEKIGGELLGLALVAPIKNEPGLERQLASASKGALNIGIALQMMDDVTDIEDDVVAHRVNLLASTVVFNGLDGKFSFDDVLKVVIAGGRSLEETFKHSKMALINAAVEKSLVGFDLLGRAAFPVGRREAVSVLKIIFHLRGFDTEWQNSNYG